MAWGEELNGVRIAFADELDVRLDGWMCWVREYEERMGIWDGLRDEGCG